MLCSGDDGEAPFEGIPVLAFTSSWDSSDGLEEDWAGALRLCTERLLSAAPADAVECGAEKAGASLASLPEDIICRVEADVLAESLPEDVNSIDEDRCEPEGEVSEIAMAVPDEASLPLALVEVGRRPGPTLLGSRPRPYDKKPAWGTPPNAVKPAAGSLAAAALEDLALLRVAVEAPLPCRAPVDVGVAGNLPSPPPKSLAAGARRSPGAGALAMVPMLRAQHMDLLDEQYLKDHFVRADAPGAGRRRSVSSSGRAPSSKGRPATAAEPRRECHAHVNDPTGEGSAANRRGCSQPRLLGPKAVMPSIKGQLHVRAAAARREAERDAREARLKEQYRSRPTSCTRAKSQPRSSKAVASSR